MVVIFQTERREKGKETTWRSDLNVVAFDFEIDATMRGFFFFKQKKKKKITMEAKE